MVTLHAQRLHLPLTETYTKLQLVHSNKHSSQKHKATVHYTVTRPTLQLPSSTTLAWGSSCLPLTLNTALPYTTASVKQERLAPQPHPALQARSRPQQAAADRPPAEPPTPCH